MSDDSGNLVMTAAHWPHSSKPFKTKTNTHSSGFHAFWLLMHLNWKSATISSTRPHRCVYVIPADRDIWYISTTGLKKLVVFWERFKEILNKCNCAMNKNICLPWHIHLKFFPYSLQLKEPNEGTKEKGDWDRIMQEHGLVPFWKFPPFLVVWFEELKLVSFWQFGTIFSWSCQ